MIDSATHAEQGPSSPDPAAAHPRWTEWDMFWVAVLATLGLVLRLHLYDQAPPLADNYDEFTWAWSGLTLITRHVPYAWTNFTSYPIVELIHANGTTYRLVHPYFDDPPLFSLVLGGFAWLRGARVIGDVTVTMIRPVAIALSTVTIPLAYALGRRALGTWPARLGCAALAVAPGAVLFGRQAEAESLIAPLFLASLLLAMTVLRGEGRWFTIMGVLACCFFAPLAKFDGLAVPAAIATLFITGGRWREAALAAAAGAMAVAAFALYGAHYDWRLWLDVLQTQAHRRHGIMAGYEFISAPAGLGRTLRDGWWLLGWLGIAMATMLRGARAWRFVAWPAMVYAATIMLLTDQDVGTYYGWYRIAAYPLVYLGAGLLAWEAVRRPAPALLAAVLALGGATASTVLFGPGPTWQPSALLLLAIGSVVVVPALLAARADAPPWSVRDARWVAYAALAAIMLGNAAESLNLARVYSSI